MKGSEMFNVDYRSIWTVIIIIGVSSSAAHGRELGEASLLPPQTAKKVQEVWHALDEAGERKDYAKQISECTKGLQLLPESLDFLSCRGNAYLKVKRYPEAIRDLTKLVGLMKSPDLFSINSLALAYLDGGHPQDALYWANKGLALPRSGLDPVHKGALFCTRSRIFAQLSLVDAAKKDLGDAAKLLGDNDRSVLDTAEFIKKTGVQL